MRLQGPRAYWGCPATPNISAWVCLLWGNQHEPATSGRVAKRGLGERPRGPKLGKKIEESEFECYLAIIWQSPCGVLQLRDSDLRSAKVGCNLVMIDLE